MVGNRRNGGTYDGTVADLQRLEHVQAQFGGVLAEEDAHAAAAVGGGVVFEGAGDGGGGGCEVGEDAG